MAICTVAYSTSGSDTNSGSNAPSTPHTNTSTGATVSGTASTNTLTFSSEIDLTGVLDDDSNVIWVAGTAGERHLFRITAFTGGKATCTGLTTSVIVGASGISASAWAIGGKRQTPTADTARTDPADCEEGWRFAFGSGTFTLATSLAINASYVPGAFLTSGPIEIVAEAGATPKFVWTSGDQAIDIPTGCCLVVDGIAFENTTSILGGANAIEAVTGTVYVKISNCSHLASGRFINGAASFFGVVRDCDIHSTYWQGISLGGRSSMSIINNEIHECGSSGTAANGKGIYIACASGLCGNVVFGNRIWGNKGTGIEFVVQYDTQLFHIAQNVVHGNGSHGIFCNGTIKDTNRSAVLNNVISENGAVSGGYGLAVASAAGGDVTIWNDFNFFYGNVSGEVSNITKGANSVTLTADPYLAKATQDFRLNGDAGGGAACKNLGYGYNG